MSRMILVALVAAALSACAGFNKSSRAMSGMGVISDEVSAFDNAREINMTPSPVIQHESNFTNCCFVGLFWKSTTADQALLTVEMDGIQNVASVELRIDDRIVALQPAEAFTEIETQRMRRYWYSTSSKQFKIKIADLRTLVNANTAMIRVSAGRDYALGDLLRDADGGMFPSVLKDWLTLIP